MATILIVDDNKKNLQVLGNILNGQSYKVAMAMDGNAALKLAPKISPDLIVLDIMMPGMDGFEVCEILKKQNETQDIPIIFLSAKIDLEDIVKGFQLGGADYVTKPFKKEELLARIRTHLELREGRKKIIIQTEELTALNSLKDKIFAVIVSDIKGALDSFIQVPKLLADTRLNLSQQEITEILSDMQHKAVNTYDLLENMMWWSSTQRSLIHPKFTRVEVATLFEKAASQLQKLSQAKTINIEIPPDSSLTVIADVELLLVVVKNLLNNAIKYSKSNSSIQIKVLENSESTNIQITDFGIGMNEETLHLIQEKYSYHTEYGTQSEKGSGLGLKVSQELLSIMKANFEINSNENEGTTVTLSFPNEPQN